MITKQKKNELLERIQDKEKRIVIANIIDMAINFEKNDRLEFTNFLDLNEQNMAISMLNTLNINYKIYSPNMYCERKVIFFLPSYIDDKEEIFDEYISCIKIKPAKQNKLLHKDYMGSIYSLGIKSSMLGDIFAYNDCAYVFCIKSISSYILTNLSKVANNDVCLEEFSILGSDIFNLKFKFDEISVIVPSLRADAILSEVYNLSRNDTKEKITKGELFVNSTEQYYGSNPLKENDVVSFKRCGKLRIGKVVRKTKSDNFVLQVYKYI